MIYLNHNVSAITLLMGTLEVTHTKGRSVFAFSYNDEWLAGKYPQQLDPDLQLFSGQQYLKIEKPNFGLFLDSSPDRWGRVLMDRREALSAKAEGRKQVKLFEEDYLLGVYDQHRMGALRFKKEIDGSFLNDNGGYAVPPWTTLRELEAASLKLETGALDEKESLQWINLLLAPGASLGGARPKASVQDEQANLWIAKFPSVKDGIDMGNWEYLIHKLAVQCGIRMSAAQAKKFNSTNHTFLTQRFDRQGQERIHFASAMTLLGNRDGHDGASYLELVEFILKSGANVGADLEELFLRIVFSIAVKNTDDHLRNHGFLLTPKGWILSPAFDINPVYFGTGLSLNIDETDNALDFGLARSVRPYFRLSGARAMTIIAGVINVRNGWRRLAGEMKISRQEQELLEGAFDIFP
ncbi:MAG: HipA domain-containing protein [Chitinophagaceae bacterium]